ncbi:20970_t:CDS:2 [Gigaspora margarita]|uniref:20970_t:CDS:1 n=1 Tax=Gigaspora margarita TaxID=4874 RepID=A0ABN7V481_GIGMA|nr:20970_t:CDS:2 [Gigaspora margarita]
MSDNNFIEFSNLNSSVKTCSRCGGIRKKEEFCYSREDNPQYENSTCNQCYLSFKNVRKEVDLLTRKKTKLQASLNTPVPRINTTVAQANINSSRSIPDLEDLELNNDISLDQSLEYLEKIKESNDTTGFLYTLDKFQDSEDSSKQVKLNFEIELDPSLVESVQQIYLNTNKKKLTICATVYLGCTQYEDRQWQRPENMPQQHTLVQCSYQLAHEYPQYRQVEFPALAKEWIRNNIKYHLQSSEIYGYLQQHEFTNAKADIHVLFNESALINKKYFEEQQGFKVIYYVKNNFVRALGFTTLLLDHICIKNIKEVVIDSTFKTNLVRFELFVINANCGALCEFLNSLQNEGFFPTFVLLDKDAGEISAVDEAWLWTVIQKKKQLRPVVSLTLLTLHGSQITELEAFVGLPMGKLVQQEELEAICLFSLFTSNALSPDYDDY